MLATLLPKFALLVKATAKTVKMGKRKRKVLDDDDKDAAKV
jgi:hypothetical protein